MDSFVTFIVRSNSTQAIALNHAYQEINIWHMHHDHAFSKTDKSITFFEKENTRKGRSTSVFFSNHVSSQR
jgi:hypothetical protein